MQTALIQPSKRDIRARERTEEWRQRNRASDLCPKHRTTVSLLRWCHKCTSEDLQAPAVGGRTSQLPQGQPPQPGERLTSCVRCTNCDRHFHEGSVYIYQPPESPRKKHGIQPWRNGSKLDYDNRKPGDPDKLLSLCGECLMEGEGVSGWAYRNPRLWSGLCNRHARAAKLETKRWKHKSGAIVLPKVRSSEPGIRKRMVKVAFICGNRRNTIHGRHLGETYLSQTKRADWRGLCADCQSRFVDPKKKLEDKLNVGRVDLLYSQASKTCVPIRYHICGHTRETPRQTAHAIDYDYQKRRRVPQGVCQGCRNNPAALISMMRERVDDKAKRPRGHQLGEIIVDRARFKSDFENIINSLRTRLPDRKITRVLIALEFQRKGENIGPDAILKRVRLLHGNQISVAEAVDLVPKKRDNN